MKIENTKEIKKVSKKIIVNNKKTGSAIKKTKTKNEEKNEDKVKKGTVKKDEIETTGANKKNEKIEIAKPKANKIETKKIIKESKKSIKKINSYDDYEDDEMGDSYDFPKDFDFKGKEKDLEKKLKEDEEDDIFMTDDDDDEYGDSDEPKDEDIEAIEKELEEDDGKREADIFDGVSLDDTVRMYLKEIGQYNLLNIEQEKKLAKEKQEAQNLLRKKKMNEQLPIDVLREIKLNPEELKIIRKGEISQKRLVECNLRLVVSIAKKYIGHGLSLLDLIQEGNLGLIRGIEKFDYKMGFKLSTYVTWWIRQAVSRALADQSKTIRIPVHMVETINRLNKTKKKLIAELGCEPTTKQIAKAMKMSEERVEEVTLIAKDPISLDKPVGDEDDSIVADFIADQTVISPETNAERIMLKEQIQELLEGLKERERKVLMLRFGIEDDHPRTLEEVGKELNVTRERIRQIEDKALRKLKYRAKNLKVLIK